MLDISLFFFVVYDVNEICLDFGQNKAILESEALSNCDGHFF